MEIFIKKFTHSSLVGVEVYKYLELFSVYSGISKIINI